jgi:hypothetical protein
MQHSEGKTDADYGISRVDDEVNRTHAWRVSLRRHGQGHVKNFPDKKCGGRQQALQQARQYRDVIVSQHPPITRVEFCGIKRSNNRSGMTGVCTYAKRYVRRDGSVKENWYWEASWPDERGASTKAVYSVNTHGNEMAKQLAINARRRGLAALEGVFWRSERGALSAGETSATSLSQADSPHSAIPMTPSISDVA